MFRNREGHLPHVVAGINVSLYKPDKCAMRFEDIQEGDIIVLTGRAWSSVFIGSFSDGASHVGQVMKLNGQLWFVEAVSRISS